MLILYLLTFSQLQILILLTCQSAHKLESNTNPSVCPSYYLTIGGMTQKMKPQDLFYRDPTSNLWASYKSISRHTNYLVFVTSFLDFVDLNCLIVHNEGDNYPDVNNKLSYTRDV